MIAIYACFLKGFQNCKEKVLDMTENKHKVFFCNTELALDIVGGKWKPLIVYHLNNNAVIRFGEFKRLIPNINERVLSRSLKELESNRIVHREDYHENPPKVEYSLTDEGKELSKIVVELGTWGKAYNEKYAYGDINFDNKYEDKSC